MRFIGTRNKTTPSAAYRRSVRRLASVNVRERKRSSGSIGFRARRSTTSSSTSATAPIASAPSTSGCVAPCDGHSSSPKTIPPSPATASAAPVQSIRKRLRPRRGEDERIRGEVSAAVRGGGGGPPPLEDIRE